MPGDIRGFFGGPKGVPASSFRSPEKEVPPASPTIDSAKKSPNQENQADTSSKGRKKLVIDDDEEDEEEAVTSAEIVISKSSPVKENKNNHEEETSKASPAAAKSPAKPAAPRLSPPVAAAAKPVIEKPATFFAKPVAEAKKAAEPTSKAKAESKPKALEKNAAAKSAISNGTIQDSMSSDIPKELESIITWKAGEKVPYSAVVECFERVAAVSGRLDKENTLAKLFRAVILTTPAELEEVVYLVSNTVAPNFEGLELGIGESLIIKAICSATGRDAKSVNAAYKEEGDLGIVALTSRASQKTLGFAAKPKPLTASHVLEQFRLITRTKGDKAQGRKIEIMKALMIKGQGAEAKYIVRAMQGKLRIGTAAQTVLVSLATAFAKSIPSAVSAKMLQDSSEVEMELEEGTTAMNTEESDEGVKYVKLHNDVIEKQPAESKKLQAGTAGEKQKTRLKEEERVELSVIAVKRAFSECPSLTFLVKALLTSPMYALYKTCRLVPGLPVAPMLAKPTKAIGEVLRRLAGQAFTMEYKYDGERAQVHLLENGTVKIFSRNSLDDTEKYPDLAQCIHTAKMAGITSCVVDCEVVAWDRENKCILPFQVLSTRKRKVEEGDEEQKVKVVLEGFDMLYCNNKSLLQESLRNRRALLHACFRHTESYFHFASGADHVEDGDTLPLETYLTEACGAMCEGLMVKTLDDNATYEPSKRSLNWLKLKKDYIEGMGVCDSVDLVVMGGYHGHGKRAGKYGAYLMGCYDPDRDEFQSVCKVGTGLKDEELIRFTEQMAPHITSNHRRPFNYNTADVLEPDDWFDATTVWELQAADLSKSSVHKGGIGKLDPERGIGLRFPRFLRERTDKKPENATNADQIVDMYNSQDLTGLDAGKKDNNDDSDEDAL